MYPFKSTLMCNGHVLAVMVLCSATMTAFATETIVMLRHAEKPATGLGQLSCQGLNRSLALPEVLMSKFGKPTAIFAPNPGVMKPDRGVDYNYIRPLATIEPTAIVVGLPVNTSLGYANIDQLNSALLEPSNHDATIFVAWEHRLLEKAARNIVSDAGGSTDQVPKWDDDDFDSLYVIQIESRQGGIRSVMFHKDMQGLDNGSLDCPFNRFPDAKLK